MLPKQVFSAADLELRIPKRFGELPIWFYNIYHMAFREKDAVNGCSMPRGMELTTVR